MPALNPPAAPPDAPALPLWPRAPQSPLATALPAPPLPHSRFWADWISSDFRTVDCSRLIAVLPVGAVEQHGPHLPLKVDSALIEAIICASLPLLPPTLPVVYLPLQAVGRSIEHENFPGTLSLSAQTTIALWMDLGRSVARTGVRSLVLFNGHGGQVSIMDIVGRDLRAETGLQVYSVNWYDLGLPPGVVDADELRFGIHAGQLESALMAAIDPASTRPGQARPFDSRRRRQAQEYPVLGAPGVARQGWLMEDLNPAGAAGDATRATAADGAAILAHVAARWAALLADIARVPPDTAARTQRHAC